LAQTDTSIVNRALLAIGAQAQVSDFSEGSTEANVAAVLYEPTRDMLLRSAHWNFTRKQASLAQLKAYQVNGVIQTGSDAPPVPWLYEYAYPSDCLKARYLVPIQAYPTTTPPPMTGATPVPIAGLPGPMSIPFVIGSDSVSSQPAQTVILTQLYQAQMVYTARIENPDLWDPMFQEAMVATLAAKFVNPLNRNATLFTQQATIARDIVLQARVTDGDEVPTSQDHLPDWIRARGTNTFGSDATFYGWWDTFSCGPFSC
jgi:hypothetical protein